MPLPASDRVVFKRNPLFGVTGQIRFPSILRIQTETPAQFQELLRGEFPIYEAVNLAQVSIPAQVPAEVQKALQMAVQGGLSVDVGKAHKFSTADGNWAVQLNQDTLTVGCIAYPKWEVFRDKLHFAWKHFGNLYRPPFATLVALRYQNAIDRKKLGLDGVPWSDLLQPFIAAQFGCQGLAESEIVSAFHRFELNLGGSDRVIVQHGTAIHQVTKDAVYAIDNNFNVTAKLELSDVFSRLDQLNSHSGSLFRLCITEKLYRALEPSNA